MAIKSSALENNNSDFGSPKVINNAINIAQYAKDNKKGVLDRKNFKENGEKESTEQLNIESEIKKQDEINQQDQENQENKLDYDFETLPERTDTFFQKTKDFININNVSILLNSPEDIIFNKISNLSNLDEKKQVVRDIKNYLKDLLIKDADNIEANDLILESNLLINEFTAKDSKTTSVAEITSLVHYEAPKEEPKQELNEDKNGQLILLSWSDFSYQIEENRIVTVQNSEDEKLKFKVTPISPDYAEPYIQITGKIFPSDLKIVNSFLTKFKQIATKELVKAE